MRRLSGYTLVELVMVIVLLGIVATVSVQFVSLSTRGAIDLGDRQQRSLAGVVISEQISRQLRMALPTSVRAGGDCIEWIPTLAASNYFDLPSGASADSFEAVPLPGGRSANGRIVVYGYGSNVYDTTSNPGPVSPVATMPASTSAPPAPVTVSFDGGATHRFAAQSPEKRFYVVGSPVAVCQSGEYLYRYKNYGFNTAIASGLPVSSPNREVLAAGLVPGSIDFSVTPPTLQRGAVVSFSLVLAAEDAQENTAISQEVQIRNVP